MNGTKDLYGIVCIKVLIHANPSSKAASPPGEKNPAQFGLRRPKGFGRRPPGNA